MLALCRSHDFSIFGGGNHFIACKYFPNGQVLNPYLAKFELLMTTVYNSIH